MTNLLEVLITVAQQSTCDKLKFGAAAFDGSRQQVTFGYNYNPFPSPGWRCLDQCVGNLRAGIKSGICVERCFSVHAEQHAILQAHFTPVEVAVAGVWPNGQLFDNGGGFYCTVCARIMASVGVQFVTVWSKGKPMRLTIEQAWDQSYAHVRRT